MTNSSSNIIIYNTTDGKASVALYARDGKIWLNQQQMAELFGTSKPNISMHIAGILKDKELDKESVVKNFLTTASDGKQYDVVFYSLEMILAVGYRVRGMRSVYAQFDAHRKSYEAQLADEEDLKLLDDLEKEVKERK